MRSKPATVRKTEDFESEKSGVVGHKERRKWAWCTIIAVLQSGVLCSALAQSNTYPNGKKPEPGTIRHEIVLLTQQAVQQQWPVTLDLINAPTMLEQVEPGQCIRFGVAATGEGRFELLKQAKFTFEVTFLGKPQVFAAESAEAVKQIKPQGGDFVSQALDAAGIKNPLASLVSLAASRAQWCAAVDVRDGRATVEGTATTADGKAVALKSRTIEVRTFETVRKRSSFKDLREAEEWLQYYYAAPDPARLLPALRLVVANEKARSQPSTISFFGSALKAHRFAADELMSQLSREDRMVRTYAIAALSWGGYEMESLVGALDDNDKAALREIHPPDPFDKTPAMDIGSRQDMLWSMFFATGRPEPVRAIASELAWGDDYVKFKQTLDSGRRPDMNDSTFRAIGYGAAGWSLSALSRQHGLIMDYLDALKTSSDTSPVIKKELENMFTNPAFRPPPEMQQK
jgi:hypothetical protein